MKFMKKTLKGDWPLSAIRDKATTMYYNNNSVLDDCALINIKRICYLSLIAASMRILDIYLFADTASAPATWGQGIFLSYLILFLFYSGSFLLTYRLKSAEQPSKTTHALQYIIPIVVLASGVVIVTIDQPVTTNITLLLIVSIVFGAVFLIRPLASFLIYITSYLAYYYLIALTIADQQVLLSNRVNGATIIALGFLISVIN